MVYNMNLLVKKASLDLTIDETTWSNMSYGGDALFQVQGKPGVTKGGKMWWFWTPNGITSMLGILGTTSILRPMRHHTLNKAPMR